jgi:acyl carrier protein
MSVEEAALTPEALCEVLGSRLGFEPGVLTPTAPLEGDLEFDSLDWMEVLTVLEEVGCENVAEDDVVTARTVAELCAIAKHYHYPVREG